MLTDIFSSHDNNTLTFNLLYIPNRRYLFIKTIPCSNCNFYKITNFRIKCHRRRLQKGVKCQQKMFCFKFFFLFLRIMSHLDKKWQHMAPLDHRDKTYLNHYINPLCFSLITFCWATLWYKSNPVQLTVLFSLLKKGSVDMWAKLGLRFPLKRNLGKGKDKED